MKQQRLKARFIITVAAVYLVLGALTYLAFQVVTGRIVDSLGTSFATKEALFEKSKLMSAIQRNLSLSIKMSDSPLLRHWTLDEDNPTLKAQAIEELENYRQHFDGHSLFFAPDRSHHYYFSDGSGQRPLDTPSYTINQGNPNDDWYFRTLRDVDTFELNIDYDNHLDVTKIWFNVIIKDASRKIGLCGSGIDITQFINEIVQSNEQGVQTILFSHDGAITGHRDSRYVLHNSKVRGDHKKTTIYNLLGSEADRDTLSRAMSELVASRRQTATFPLTVEHRPNLAAMTYLPEIRWFNLVLVDPSGIVSNRAFLPILVITIISLLAVVLIIGWLLNRRVLTPLATLADSSRQIARGNFNISMPVRSTDEIGALTRCFNEMAHMVKEHSENLEQLVAARTTELDLSNRRLAESNDQIMDSIRYARLIQSSILPEAGAIGRRVSDFFVIYRPRDIVGGDFYFFRENGDHCFLAVIDCTGHGVPGACMTMTAHAILGHVLDTVGDAPPSVILARLNRLMRAALNRDGADSPIDNGLDIGLCRWTPAQRQLEFAGARIDLHCATQGDLTVIHGNRQAIGYRTSNVDFQYTTHNIPVDGPMMFYLTSDGVLDQSGGPKGWSLGRKRFGAMLTGLCKLSAVNQQAALEQAIQAYQGDCAQRDDITILGFRL